MPTSSATATTLPKDERYARTDEYVHILKRIWTETGPVDHEGKYYRFVGASTAMRCVQQPRIPIYFGGASDAAIAVAGKHADVYALWGETHEQVRELTARVRAAAAQHGREVRFSLSLRPILAPTEDEAWARAEAIKQTHCGTAREGRPRPARAAERGLAPPAGRRGAGRAAGQAAVDRCGAADRRARQHHQPGRHAAAGGRGVVRLLRPRRHHVPDPRLRSAGRRDRIRPQPAAADPPVDRRAHADRGGIARCRCSARRCVTSGRSTGIFSASTTARSVPRRAWCWRRSGTGSGKWRRSPAASCVPSCRTRCATPPIVWARSSAPMARTSRSSTMRPPAATPCCVRCAWSRTTKSSC